MLKLCHSSTKFINGVNSIICKYYMFFVQLTYCILYDFRLGGVVLVSSSARSSALISKKLVAFVTGLRQLRRFDC
jgi:hypothetical protein